MKVVASPFIVLALAACCTGCVKDDKTLAAEIAQGMMAACPLASPDDEEARARCSAKLGDLAPLKGALGEGMVWGGQKPGRGYRLDKFTTRFNTLVWRKMYLSLFMFTGYRVEEIGGVVVLHLPYRFRGALDAGSYPYPFWHSATKWESWNLSTELLLIFDKGTITGALRNAERDTSRSMLAHTWDGQWNWNKAGQSMPYVSLYNFIFNPANPHVSKLENAYREMEAEMRPNLCFVCHSPDNRAEVDQLEFFNYPNQALYSRHNIVRRLLGNTMPPPNDAGIAAGIPSEEGRQKLLGLARAFAAAGDEALAWEDELKPQLHVPDVAVVE